MLWRLLLAANFAAPSPSMADSLLSCPRDAQHPHEGIPARVTQLSVCKLDSFLHLSRHSSPLILFWLCQLFCDLFLLFSDCIHTILIGFFRHVVLQDVDLLAIWSVDIVDHPSHDRSAHGTG